MYIGVHRYEEEETDEYRQVGGDRQEETDRKRQERA